MRDIVVYSRPIVEVSGEGEAPMDPNLFRIDWEKLAEVLAAVVVLSFVVERALAIVFEHRYFLAHFSKLNIQEAIAFLVSFAICRHWDFDLVSVVLSAEKSSILGHVITAAVIAGGSKASIKLFQDVMGVKSSALQAKGAQPAGVNPAPAGGGQPAAPGGQPPAGGAAPQGNAPVPVGAGP